MFKKLKDIPHYWKIDKIDLVFKLCFIILLTKRSVQLNNPNLLRLFGLLLFLVS